MPCGRAQAIDVRRAQVQLDRCVERGRVDPIRRVGGFDRGITCEVDRVVNRPLLEVDQEERLSRPVRVVIGFELTGRKRADRVLVMRECQADLFQIIDTLNSPR